jgi:hypothetical protein
MVVLTDTSFGSGAHTCIVLYLHRASRELFIGSYIYIYIYRFLRFALVAAPRARLAPAPTRSLPFD